jgi:predicted DNA-binding transcriptional regulator YafY
MAGSRAGGVAYAQRVNEAADLLAGGASAVDAASVLATRFGVSTRQARRYVDQAAAGGRLVVPQTSVVFTVKLPPALVTRVRRRAARSGVTISALVAEALTEFLSAQHRRGPRG